MSFIKNLCPLLLQKVENITPMSSLESLGFLHAFIASLSVIVVSELGDKTFFIAAIMAMRHPRLTVFAGAITALAVMTVLSGIFFATGFNLLYLLFSIRYISSLNSF